MPVSGTRQRRMPREPRRFQVGDTKHLDCVIREAQCRADSGTFQQSLEQALDAELSRMRMLGIPAERIAAFREGGSYRAVQRQRAAKEHRRGHPPARYDHHEELLSAFDVTAATQSPRSHLPAPGH